MNSVDYVGSLVYSTAGRDKGKLFIITGIIDNDYVYISDGELRTIEKPKKKKLKHLSFTAFKNNDVAKAILTGDKVSNSAVKKGILLVNSKEEV